MSNPFEEITIKLDALAAEVRALKNLRQEKQQDEIGGMDLAEAITGLAARTIYKLTSQRDIPHRRVRGRLYFRRAELTDWLDSGRRPTATEVARERMQG